MEADKQERKKQRHTAKRIFDRLAKEHPGFDCSYRLVADYVSRKKKEIYGEQEGFYMPLIHIPGEAQVDFGEADFFDRNVRCTGHYLNVSFPHSNADYLQIFKGEKMNIFAHIGGVPIRLWFDNLSPAVKTILKDDGRELTDAFLRFKNHYGFATAFCNPGQGHEKGSVETKVGYHRRNMLVPVPRVDDLKALLSLPSVL
jgi:transposase